MMRQKWVVLLLCVLFIARPTPARAWWWEWLDEYSGPGPFEGFSLQWRLLCFSDPKPERGASSRRDALQAISYALDFGTPNIQGIKTQLMALGVSFPPAADVAGALSTIVKTELDKENDQLKDIVGRIREKHDPGDDVLRSFESFVPKTDESRAAKARDAAMLIAGLVGVSRTGCELPSQHARNPTAALSFRYSWAHSKRNGLFNDGQPHQVDLNQFEFPFTSYVLQNKALEVGTAIGWMDMSGDDFARFRRFYWKPIMMSVAPVPLKRYAWPDKSTSTPEKILKDAGWVLAGVARTFTVNAYLLYMPQGFTAADFGQPNGTFSVSREIVGGWGFVFDLSRF